MRNKNAVRHAAQNFVIAVAVMILAGCGQNPGGDYTSSSPILPAVADTVGSSLDLTIPLDVAVAASNPQRFAVRGKYIAIDPGSTGQANLRLNSISDTARLAYPGSTFNPGDFTDLYFDYQAQPGKVLHVLYGDSPDILSSGNKTTLDPNLNVIYAKLIHDASACYSVFSAVDNPRGAKLLGGTITGFMFTSAVQKYGSFNLQTNEGLSIPIMGFTVPSNTVASAQDFREIPLLNIAPNVGLDFCLSSVGVGVGFGYLYLNYQLL